MKSSKRCKVAEINEAKKILANEATKLCHGPEAALTAAETARKTFEQGGAGDNLKTYFIDKNKLDAGIALIDLFQETGMQESKGAARKLIEGGGAKLNDEKVADTKILVNASHLTSEGYIKLSAGKKTASSGEDKSLTTALIHQWKGASKFLMADSAFQQELPRAELPSRVRLPQVLQARFPAL